MSKLTEENADKVSLFYHELTHYIDHCSTLWGQKNITLLFNAINAFANQDIDDFWRIKLLDNTFRQDRFYHYFSEKHSHIVGDQNNRWRYSITSGVRFNNEGKPDHKKPILFVRFSSHDEKPISRVPVSVASILETNAIKAEFDIKIQAMLLDKEPVSRIIREKNLNNEIIGLLYHPDLTLYSVIAHLTANLNNDNDIIRTLNTTSAIGTLVLNFPEKLYQSLKVPEISEELWKERYKSFINDKDIGATYYFLLKNLIDTNGQNSFTEELILSSSNLPEKSEVIELVLSEMEENKKNLIEGPFKKMATDILEQGIKMFKKRGLFSTNDNFREYIMDNKLFPPIIFGDTILKTDGLNVNDVLEKVKKGEEISVHEKYFIMEYYDKKFNEFNEVCGV
ncbi:hypothetical protein [Tenacibaculum maritimum]|uniref:hypothetical protein n=1 Tax=Tenacibaculum maritimum TaxID=107401 RepID=UPI001E65618E|nr:hypothetical protein [Tenacibaculum maritimum]MCD9564320.1 hypothetical protein [Tenacibaculum maritimum]MCD9567064.1 hypothetical protein [Tenacibaculum maritimum]MCD9578800.1 hypothetical protein [Tenacibaculum maritimum]MCD9598021.1 hypothetical protein [Tenacibaculum maritimum]MCD9614934.1 hypothetical protein [Tenacibaculum maritimum]